MVLRVNELCSQIDLSGFDRCTKYNLLYVQTSKRNLKLHTHS